MLRLRMFNAIIGVAGILAFLATFYFSPVRRSRLWTITVTPLASIIGSGFLIATPLMYMDFGGLALAAMVIINLFALGIGQVIRFNIRHFDSYQDSFEEKAPHLVYLEHFSNLALGLSYTISIAFYIALLSGFALRMLGLHSDLGIRVLSTLVLGYIGITGLRGGLHGLERLEKIAMHMNLSIIGGLIAALVAYGLQSHGQRTEFPFPQLNWRSFQILGGMLLITQGFETTKYLGVEYDAESRVRAAWLAQIIAAFIYIVFVLLVAVLIPGVKVDDETAIVSIVDKAAWGFGTVLSVGAIFSQFGAAVADTVGTGGLLEEETRGRLSEDRAYI
ncbi:MAG: hypothetical protein J7M34_05160, partial [Anaerolineae bacterium]|nr:hypothetical protein [Anaerolineae bacterium]